jgi:hypothetical protein
MGPKGMLDGGFGFGWSGLMKTTFELIFWVRLKMSFYLAYNNLDVISC